MKILKLMVLGSLLFFSACSNMSKEQNYVAVEKNSMGKVVNVEFAGQCAYAVSQGNFKAKGKDAIKYEDKGGRIYYFGSEAAKNKFVGSMTKYKNMASHNWNEYLRSIDK